MKHQQPTAALHFVQGLRFSCTGCGKCCNNDWDLPVTNARAESIQKTDTYENKTRLGYTPLKLIKGTFILGTRDNGECVFLDGSLCEIHRDHGADAKPLTCQLFPLNLVKAPDGYHISLSYACPAVISGIGPPLEERREWLDQFLLIEDDIPPLSLVPETISISALCEVPYAEYLELESKLLGCLDDSLCPQGFINWACTLLEFGPSFSAAEFSPLQVSPLLEEALSLLDIFGRTVVGILEAEPEQRGPFIESLAEDGLGRSRRTGATFPNFSYYRPPSEIARSVTLKFFRSQIQGKRLLTGQTVVSRLLTFGTGFAILCYYLEAQAKEYKSLHFSFEHLERAFAIVEENILTHSDDLEPFFIKFEDALCQMLG